MPPNPPPATSLSRRRLLGAGMTAGAGAMLVACGGPAGEIEAPKGEPERGGRLRVGLTGGGASDTLDAHLPVNTTDIARCINLYETLLYYNDDYVLTPLLATKVTSSPNAKVWTAHLRRDVVFHDGRPMTGKDVAATFARITDPKDPKSGAAGLTDLDKVVVAGEHKVEFHLKSPNAAFDDSLGQYANGIVPADYDPKHPVGTGPFKVKSFTAGQQSVFARHDHYWRQGQPYLDELVILDFSDDDAIVNALLSSQVDAIGQIPLALTQVIGSDPRVNVLTSPTGSWMPFTMRIDKKPFDDKRVRQAFRLAVDRKQMIEQVYSGHGRIGNDMYAPFDPAYSKDLPQRRQDIRQAKKLLADAGHPNGLDVELVTAPIQSGAVEAAQVFAQQAKKAGIRVNIRRVDSTTFFGDNYLKWTFAQDFWYTRNFLPQVNSGTAQDAPFNETHWKNAKFTKLVAEATKTINEGQRNRLIEQAQKILYDEGGYIIWGFSDQADAYQKYVAGLKPNRTGLSLSGFQFRRVWLGGSNS
ncbi:ABC transporter substrate-binding protein [Spelaeicoccus albus]|uniref:Peptide/nickel transport system substrate-binding protein n=1 Tax=Spelaeicoccus albus TaxID=1280376 RepID=A0A7Z0D238_9MICO|nr:ABC transporter substrate-binding protein [Spelaeicoccus albus]NYI67449.1 peptide/nickel transport system substrate-binding protein [Spelaeicoccus albus]